MWFPHFALNVRGWGGAIHLLKLMPHLRHAESTVLCGFCHQLRSTESSSSDPVLSSALRDRLCSLASPSPWVPCLWNRILHPLPSPSHLFSSSAISLTITYFFLFCSPPDQAERCLRSSTGHLFSPQARHPSLLLQWPVFLLGNHCSPPLLCVVRSSVGGERRCNSGQTNQHIPPHWLKELFQTRVCDLSQTNEIQFWEFCWNGSQVSLTAGFPS